jgi:outer membrane protein assembly factor BamB
MPSVRVPRRSFPAVTRFSAGGLARGRRLPLVLLALLAGCFGSSGPKMAELTELRNSVPVRLAWEASVGSGEGAIFSPAVIGGSVYAAAHDGTVVRLDAAGGGERWRVNAGEALSGGVGSDGDLVAVGSEEGQVIALEAATGKIRWRARVSSEVLSSPAVTGDLVLVRSADSRLFALDAKDGKRRWLYQRASPPLSIRSSLGIAVSRGLAIAGFSGGKLMAVALANGSPRWEATVAVPRGSTELERVTDVVGLPAVTEREVCAAAYQGRVGCFDIANANPFWTRELSSSTSVSLDARFVFVSDEKGSVHALDRSAGTSVWKQDKLFLRRLSAPLPLGREVAVGDVEGYVHLLSRDTGAFVARVETDGSGVNADLVRLANGFLAQTRKGGLYAFTVDEK